MMNWSEYEEEQQRPTILPLLCWIASFVVAIVLVASLTGCASTSGEVRICYVELVGKTETGLFVEAQVCMTPEAYAESQK